SALWRAMQRAIDHGHYDVSGYADIEDAERDVRDRILLQEFAYWYLTTAWDLQRTYGPDEEEWTLRTPDELKAAFPVFHGVFERTAGRTLSPPLATTLASIEKAARRR
ncbi:MAG: hypothetical protein AAGG01_22930, partial [Planctomycetota bacterium]